MLCPTFFEPHLAWLNQQPAEPSLINVVSFQLSGHGFPPFSGAIYTSGAFRLQQTAAGEKLLLSGACLVSQLGTKFGDKPTFSKEYIRLFIANGPLERNDEASGKLIQSYTAFDCLDNGSLTCGNRHSTLMVTFMDSTEPVPIQ